MTIKGYIIWNIFLVLKEKITKRAVLIMTMPF